MRVDGSQSPKLSSNVVCSFAFALLLVLAAGPVQAQVATAMNFQTSEVTSSGAQVRSSKDFTLYALGYWQRPATPQIEAASAIDAEEVVIREVGAGQRDPCLSPPLPPYVPGLARTAAERRLRWWGVVTQTECRYGLPAGLLDALIIQESRYSPLALSRAGAAGLVQLMPFTARELRVVDSFDPASNIDGGARYLRAMLGKFGAVPLALAAYNAGPGAVGRAGGIPPNSETPGYVRAVLGYWAMVSSDPLAPVRHTAQLLGFARPDLD